MSHMLLHAETHRQAQRLTVRCPAEEERMRSQSLFVFTDTILRGAAAKDTAYFKNKKPWDL